MTLSFRAFNYKPYEKIFLLLALAAGSGAAAAQKGDTIRVVSSSPRWKPGVQGIELKDGTVIVPVEPVPVRIVVPVNFLDPQKTTTM